MLENVHHCRLPFVPKGNRQHFLLYQTNAVESLIFAIFKTEDDTSGISSAMISERMAALRFVLVLLAVIGSDKFCSSDLRCTWSHDALTCEHCTCVLIDIVRTECVIQNVHHAGLRLVLPYLAFSILRSLESRRREHFSGRVPGTKVRAQWCVVRVIRSGTYLGSTSGLLYMWTSMDT